MERIAVVDILSFYREIDGNIQWNKRVLRNIEDEYYNTIGGGTMDGMPHGNSGISDPTANTAINIPKDISEEVREISERLEKLPNLKIAILQELSKLPLLEKSILYDFYISNFSWVRISGRVHYSVTQCKKIRNRGLDSLKRQFAENSTITNFDFRFTI